MKKELQVGCYVIICNVIEPQPSTLGPREIFLTNKVAKITNITEKGEYGLERYRKLFHHYEIATMSEGIKFMKTSIKEDKEQLKLYQKHKKLNSERNNER